MKIILDLSKSLEENANEYFQSAKKARRKVEGARETIKRFTQQAEKESKKTEVASKELELKAPKKEWYHKYHWSTTTEGKTIIAGQNAGANELLVKSHAGENDLIFHTDMAGSPFTILQGGEGAGENELQEAANLTAAYSKAWGKGLVSIEVFYVSPQQVTKEAQSGEYLVKGAFMIRGETTYLAGHAQLSIGIIQNPGELAYVFAGSEQACQKYCKNYLNIVPGKMKTSDVAKQLRAKMGGDLDEYVKALPTGGCTIVSSSNQ